MSRGLKLCLAGLLLTFTVAWFGRESCFSAFGRYLTKAHRGLLIGDVVVVPSADHAGGFEHRDAGGSG